MTNPNFSPNISSNEIYRDLNTTVCLTDLLDGYDADIDALQADVAALESSSGGGNYAAADHTHSEYATTASVTALQTTIASKADANHTHSGYATTENVAALQTTVSGKADANHTHDYAAANHNHDADYADISHTHSASDITGLPTGGNNGITESGTSGIWTYEKYDNGKLVCEGLLTCSGVFNKRYWEMRYRDATQAYPVAFVGTPPMVQATAQCDIGFPQVTVYHNTLTNIGVRAFNPHDPVHDVKVAIRAVGKWK